MSVDKKVNLLNYFPSNFTPRSHQIKVLEQISDAIHQGKKYIVVNAPTGFGKSMIPATIANYARKCPPNVKADIEGYLPFTDQEYTWSPSFGATVLTVTKALQDQYTNDFSELEILKGRANYQCNYDNEYDVESGPCNSSRTLLGDCWRKNRCSYYEDRNFSLTNDFSVYNYSVFFSLPPDVKHRQFLILDEASELEEELVNNFSLDILYEQLKKLEIDIEVLKTEDEYKAREWAVRLVEMLKNNYASLRDKITAKNLSPIERSKIISKFRGTKNLLIKAANVLQNWGTVNDGSGTNSSYVVELIKDNKSGETTGVTFTPLKVDKLAQHIFRHAEHVILMSATIIDHKSYLKDLGITENYSYIESPSCFDPKKSRIYKSSKYPLNYKMLDKNLPTVVDIVDGICKKHSNEKGLIHTVNFKITQALKKKLKGNRFLYREDGATNQDILESHKQTSDPTVLISPSMSHGVDLKGDLGRFQVIMKIPYLPISNKRIKTLMETNFNWYQRKMLSTLVQMSGRCTRSEDDESTTYIVDGAIEQVITRNWKKLPLFFRDRFSVKGDTP